MNGSKFWIQMATNHDYLFLILCALKIWSRMLVFGFRDSHVDQHRMSRDESGAVLGPSRQRRKAIARSAEILKKFMIQVSSPTDETDEG
jgi:hypothetical protein